MVMVLSETPVISVGDVELFAIDYTDILDGTETLQRLALLRDGSDRLIAPLEHLLPMPGHAGAVASAHLAGLWRQALARLLRPAAHA